LIPRRWVERTAAPHSSVAVRHRQRRGQARAQGHRGIAGRGPPQAGGHRPMSPSQFDGGAWGERGGTTGARAAPSHGRRSVAADVPARLAQRLQRSRPHDHEQRRRCGRRATKRSDWRGGRAAASTSRYSVFSGPAPGLAGDRGGDLAGAAPSGAQRSDLQAGQFAKRASLTRSVRETGPAIPGHGKGPPRASAGSAGLTVLRQGWKPDRGETPVPPVARRAARKPGPAQRGDARAHKDLAPAPAPKSQQPAPQPPAPRGSTPGPSRPASTWLADSRDSSISSRPAKLRP